MTGPDSEQSFADLLNGITLAGGSRRGRKGKKDTPAAQKISLPAQPVATPSDDVEESAAIVRPYSWTGGRTTSDFQLEIETMVSVGEELYAGPIKAEYQDVMALCEGPRSVAEVAALLGIPLGVAKVLLGDMAERGLLDVHATAVVDGDIPDLGLMERVLSGLRKL
ncbi:DUF742 domain-containing protein [Umezawaea endophytica]|uniref:DUF742 domain-containing protein n=1 Tax=Umezawaea endophytica TaxID=1654476 RepID=A0A9X3A4R2_9PSEU|nr:DUF742 domain-containing protein [Umezawaea endophytica]MCS7481528.1 DUF742 domain-containing protein [Umezawaea endophytica]